MEERKRSRQGEPLDHSADLMTVKESGKKGELVGTCFKEFSVRLMEYP